MRRCATEGCREVSIINYQYRRDYDDAVRREKNSPLWKCSRHEYPEQVLSVTNRETTATIVASNKGKYDFLTWDGYWSGHCAGPGFKAWAQDFPPGTRLIVTARIELPVVEGRSSRRCSGPNCRRNNAWFQPDCRHCGLNLWTNDFTPLDEYFARRFGPTP